MAAGASLVVWLTAITEYTGGWSNHRNDQPRSFLVMTAGCAAQRKSCHSDAVIERIESRFGFLSVFHVEYFRSCRGRSVPEADGFW
ncbi:uncharacterized protein BDV17DRAFT_95595 [Aspergillus undulatus]|uniref:uncharacterized protein n=1 Tax=Aspergillus undulatus TaxID=1810928 RepID=UPI003CCE3579